MKQLLLTLVLIGLVQATRANEVITVGSKNFTESYLLAEIVSKVLEARGFEVERKFGLGGTLVCYEALKAGEIDVYVEYTGTIEQVILKGNNLHPEVADLNRRIDEQLLLLDSLGFNNTYAITMQDAKAVSRGISNISDLARQSDLVLALSLEFLNREDGWPGLAQTHGLPHEPTGIDHGLAYQAINGGSIDVTDAYSTDGDLERYALRILIDDQAYFPDYYAVPFLRRGLPETAIDAIADLTGRISDDRMRKLNAEIVIQKKTFSEVAAAYLDDEGIAAGGDEGSDLFSSILKNTIVHLKLTSIALLLGCLTGLPLGILAYRKRQLARVVVYVAGLMQTIPSIALLALMIPLFGIGEFPAIVALFLYSILPILRNTITALITIDPVLKRVATALGLTRSQQLRHVLLPMALPGILAGIKTAAIISIGTATLAAFIGAGGLGEPIVTGLALNDTRLILQGAIPAAMLAIVVEILFEILERLIVKPHMLQSQLSS